MNTCIIIHTLLTVGLNLSGRKRSNSVLKWLLTTLSCELPFPREQDQWIVVAFEECGFSPKELATLNRVRLRQQALFLSDALCVQGKLIDPK